MVVLRLERSQNHRRISGGMPGLFRKDARTSQNSLPIRVRRFVGQLRRERALSGSQLEPATFDTIWLLTPTSDSCDANASSCRVTFVIPISRVGIRYSQ
jgi:hypothetical protein